MLQAAAFAEATADVFVPLPTAGDGEKGGHFAAVALQGINERYKAALSKAAVARKDMDAPSARIVGGVETAPGAYPWMAAIVRSDVADNFQAQFCGGSLVHPYWVVTAAHCVQARTPGSIEVLLGAHHLSDDVDVTRHAVAEIIIHPEYRASTMGADIALLRLAEPADAGFVPVRLIDEDDLAAPEVMARALGWGRLTHGGIVPQALREVDVPVVSLDVANATASYDGELTESMLAAGFQQGGKDTCQGDSGGPLMVIDPRDGAWVLAGVTSFGDGCGKVDAYGIYARVFHFRPFVVRHLWPAYGQWEVERGVMGETRVSEGGVRNHFAAFALGDGAGEPPRVVFWNDGGAIRPALAFRGRGLAGEADFGFEHAPSPGGPWTSEPAADALVSSPPVAGMPGVWDVTLAALQSPPPGRLFLRASAVPSAALVPGVRVFDTTRWVGGALAPGDSAHPDFPDRLSRTYRLDGITPGAEMQITGRSQVFDVRLELLGGGMVRLSRWRMTMPGWEPAAPTSALFSRRRPLGITICVFPRLLMAGVATIILAA